MSKEQNCENEDCPELDFSFADYGIDGKPIRDLGENDVPTNCDEYPAMGANGYGGYGFYRYEQPFEMYIFYCTKDIPKLKLRKGEVVILNDTDFSCNIEDGVVTNMVIKGYNERFDKIVILKDEMMFLENISFNNTKEYLDNIASYVFELIEDNDLWKK